MTETLDKTGPAPETRSLSFLLLLFSASAAPLFWLGQMMLGYAVTAYACYPGDHPTHILYGSSLSGALIGFDVVAIMASAAGCAVALWCWRHVSRQTQGAVNFRIGESRVRFLALWGIFSSLWFFAAVVFNTIGSLTVPPCLI